MKKYFLFLFLCIFILGTGCNLPSLSKNKKLKELSNFLLYENKEKHFKIQYPKDWTKKEGTSVIVSFVSPQVESLNVLTVPTSATLDEIASSVIKNTEESYKNFRLVELENLTINSEPAKKLVMEYTSDIMKSDIRLTQIFLLKEKKEDKGFLLKGHEEYIITFLNTQKNPTAYEDEFEKIVNSFEFID